VIFVALFQGMVRNQELC